MIIFHFIYCIQYIYTHIQTDTHTDVYYMYDILLYYHTFILYDFKKNLPAHTPTSAHTHTLELARCSSVMQTYNVSLETA